MTATATALNPTRMPRVAVRFGEHYGRWTVLADGVGKRTRVPCVCDCGATREVTVDGLRRGQSRSCGCLSAERTAERSRVDLTGQRFGRLVAVRRTEQRTGAGTCIWLCRCDCGRFVTVSVGSLSRSNRPGTRSCGCLTPDLIRERCQLDVTGWRFGRLVALERVGRSPEGRAVWRCGCDCGRTTDVRLNHLRSGDTRSCGCLAAELSGERNRTHGLSGHSLFRTWMTMHARCRDRNATSWKDYGGRGIAVCERWSGPDGFPNFLADMGERPEGKTLDRIDNDGNYEPGNCRWATPTEQSANRRNSRRRTVVVTTLHLNPIGPRPAMPRPPRARRREPAAPRHTRRPRERGRRLPAIKGEAS